MNLIANDNGFETIDHQELHNINGGGWLSATLTVVGTVAVVAGAAMIIAPAAGVVSATVAATTAYRVTRIALTAGGAATKLVGSLT